MAIATDAVLQAVSSQILALAAKHTDGPEDAAALLQSVVMATLAAFCRMDRRAAENWVQDFLDTTRAGVLAVERECERRGGQ